MTQKLSFPDHDREPQGRYQVWHKEGEGYVHVANADVGNLLAALILPLMPLGTPETERIMFLVEGTRLTDFGDVIVNPTGAAYQIVKAEHGPTYRAIDFAPSKQQAVRNFAEIVMGTGSQLSPGLGGPASRARQVKGAT